MITIPPAPRSELFLLRVWTQLDTGEGPRWQGKLQPMLSGEAHYFADWAGLIALLARLVDAGPPELAAPPMPGHAPGIRLHLPDASLAPPKSADSGGPGSRNATADCNPGAAPDD